MAAGASIQRRKVIFPCVSPDRRAGGDALVTESADDIGEEYEQLFAPSLRQAGDEVVEQLCGCGPSLSWLPLLDLLHQVVEVAADRRAAESGPVFRRFLQQTGEGVRPAHVVPV
ncbi:hypothetical protein [Streptomyces zaomyceticus]|uniref:hypothetical protein n=1 Tax=Streptomyces zaomyceticus TaxID=68286 RepID=UPI003420314D